MATGHTSIGKIIGGGIKQHLRADLNIAPEEIDVGAYVLILGERWNYYALVSDLFHSPSRDPRFAEQPVQQRLPAGLARRVNRQALKPIAELMTNLCVPIGDEAASSKPLPATSLPPLHAPVCLAEERDIERLFGQPDQPGFWIVGYTREQGYPIAVDLKKMIKRSVGFFGATGTGKSMFARVVLTGLITLDLASSLTFDLHNELAFDDTAIDTGALVPGLKTIFGKKIRAFGLGKGTRIRGHPPDTTLEISLTDIQPSEILLLADELNLTDATSTVIHALLRSFGKGWLREFLRLNRNISPDEEHAEKSQPAKSVAAWAEKAKVNKQSAEALWSKLARLNRLTYLVDKPEKDGIQLILAALKRGEHVTISFGDHETDLDFLLVTNLIARRISQAWQQDAEHYRSTQKDEPRPLVVVTEEAHKFLNKQSASQTVFGDLARESRKSYVTVWLIDQRPSQINDEVLSQLGTRICGWLGDEKDINAALAGLHGNDVLRRILSSLQPNGQMLIAGWAIPTPIALRSRWFDTDFAREIQTKLS